MKARYKYKVGELVVCYIPSMSGEPQILTGIVYSRNRERQNGWIENLYSIFLQGEYNNHFLISDKICLTERQMAKL
jgi:hypothetical protein